MDSHTTGTAELDKILGRTELDEQSGCWIWKGGVTGGKSAYGVAKYRGALYRVHRLAYEHFVGPIPPGLVLDHLCHTADRECPGGRECKHTRCANPEHLEPVTQAENVRRSHRDHPERYGKYQRSRTHCPAGHPYEGDNLYVSPGNGKRFCRECGRESSRKQAEKRKQRKRG